MGRPSYDDATLAEYFQPVHPRLYEDPIVGPILRALEKDDPDLVAAVADVDRSLVRDALAKTPEERLRACFRLAETIEEMRRGAR